MVSERPQLGTVTLHEQPLIPAAHDSAACTLLSSGSLGATLAVDPRFSGRGLVLSGRGPPGSIYSTHAAWSR
jgi:hypothetical protein